MRRFFIAVICCFLLFAAMPSAQAGLDAGMAKAWFEKGVAALAKGDAETAFTCAKNAIEFSPNDADALFLSALAALELDMPLSEAIDSMLQALTRGGFKFYKAADCRIAYANALLRNKRYEEAARALELLNPSDRIASDALLARAKILFFTNQRKAYLEQIGKALAAFPEDPRFALFLLAHENAKIRDESARPLVDLIAKRLESLSKGDAAILLEVSAFLPYESERRSALIEYRARGGSDPKCALRYLEEGLLSESDATREFRSYLRADSWISISTILGMYDAMRTAETRASFVTMLSVSSFLVGEDLNNDGYPEARTRYKDGALSTWLLDRDQDGVGEMSATFADSVPTRFELNSGVLNLLVDYARYPSVNRVLVRKKGELDSTIDIVPDSLMLGFVDFSPLFPETRTGSNELFGVVQDSRVGIPTEKALMSSAFRRTSPQADGSLLRYEIEDGLIILAEKIRDGKVMSRYEYHNGLVQVERKDSLGMGRFDTTIQYAQVDGKGDSVAVSLVQDINGDGLPEYSENLQYPYTKRWDYNKDGIWDCIEEMIDKDRKQTRFSTRLDGNYDIAITRRGDAIESVKRNGVQVPIVADSGKGLFWIGKKPFDLGNFAPAIDGIYTQDGIRYSIITVGMRRYAEVLP